MPLLRAAAWLGDRLGAGPVTGESLTMLMHGNTAPVAPLIEATGYRPKSLDATLAAIPCGAAERWRAKLWPFRAPLRISLALLWIATGLVSLGLYPVESSLVLLAEVGLERRAGAGRAVRRRAVGPGARRSPCWPDFARCSWARCSSPP